MTVQDRTTVPYAEALAQFEPVIGLETHVELGTASKMFCGCDTTFGAEPNTHVCPVCLGLPGALPVVNAQAIESTIRIGLALHCDIASWCRFARKNYFYPDMPKNFQTSQYDEPLCTDGYLDVEVDGETVRIPIERVHLEEDTGKSLHVNVSLNRPGEEWGTRSETKNVNSLRSVERAVRSEVERQAARLRAGERIVQETRHFSEATGTSSPGRSKEEATDYRYFPEPDLVPVAPDPAWVAALGKSLPERPSVKRARLREDWGISEIDM